MGIQSAVMAEQFGTMFQYGKRRISAMSNDEFNKLTYQDLQNRMTKQLEGMIPEMEKQIQAMRPMVQVIIAEFANYIKLALEALPNLGGGIGVDDFSHLEHGHLPHGELLPPPPVGTITPPPTYVPPPTLPSDPTIPAPTGPTQELGYFQDFYLRFRTNVEPDNAKIQDKARTWWIAANNNVTFGNFRQYRTTFKISTQDDQGFIHWTFKGVVTYAKV